MWVALPFLTLQLGSGRSSVGTRKYSGEHEVVFRATRRSA